MKNPSTVAVLQQLESFFIVQRNVVNVDSRAVIMRHLLESVFNNGQIGQAQKIHFQKTEVFHGVHFVLGDDVAFVGAALEGQVFGQRFRGDHHGAGVSGRVPGHAFQTQSGVNQFFGVGVGAVGLAQFHYVIQTFAQKTDFFVLVGIKGNQFGDAIAKIVGKAQRPASVADTAPGHHCAKSDDLGKMVLAVFLPDVLENLIPPGIVKIQINVRGANSFLVQKSFEIQIIP